MPASVHLWHGRWRSHPFLLLRQRWQRGLDDKSSSSVASWCWKLADDAEEALRESAIEYGDGGIFEEEEDLDFDFPKDGTRDLGWVLL